MDTEQKIEGLPVPDYRAQSDEAVAAVTVMKHLEEQILQMLDAVREDPALSVDQRWLFIGRTHIEQGFMAVNRSIFKPDRTVLPGPSLAEILSD